MSKKSDTPYYVGLGIVILIFGYFAVTNVIDYIEKDKVVDSNRSVDRDPVADKFLVKFNKVPDFEFINQNGDTVTNETLLGKVYIVDFFFTTCPTICTPMSRNLSQVTDKLSKYDDYRSVSITIDPQNDTPAVLKEYADRYQANDTTWYFLTGDKAATYELVQKGFNSYVGESDDPAIRFEHSGNFALVDRDGYIRSRKDAQGNPIYVYSGITEQYSEAQLEEIMDDAETLLNK
ncbi:SCO family protein [Nonlabens ponticola]|uniref:SCO family protein n=1 Tax=Nonlabens ponticola TaxID=2496866 RepID=A0A3S9MVZ9_9FLAO|nr:SCO family protein [Nonlabens ponticola]AZQ43307.1 SCO family protein [Nonlabens ponticola]